MKYYNHHRYQCGLKKMTPVQYSVQESSIVSKHFTRCAFS
ncbi:IS3 family transposase [Paenibacillus hexagrammi]